MFSAIFGRFKSLLHSIQLQRNMLATFNSMLVSSLEPLTSTFTDRQQEILNESGYSDLMRNSSQIINCAMLLSLGYIREATTYAESCGGGSSPDSGWGRDKDEDDDHWWRRCIAVSAAMMRPAKYRLRRGRWYKQVTLQIKCHYNFIWRITCKERPKIAENDRNDRKNDRNDCKNDTTTYIMSKVLFHLSLLSAIFCHSKILL